MPISGHVSKILITCPNLTLAQFLLFQHKFNYDVYIHYMARLCGANFVDLHKILLLDIGLYTKIDEVPNLRLLCTL